MGASVIKKGRKVLLGKKVGMTQVFQDDGGWIPVTVLEVGPCTVLQVKSEETDGYASLQVGFDATHKAPPRPQQGLFRKAGVPPQRLVREIPVVGPADVSRVPLRSEVGGTVEYKGLVDGKTLAVAPVSRTGQLRRAVLESEGGAAALLVKDSSGKVAGEYALPAGSTIEVGPGHTVADGDLLAYVPVGDTAPDEVAPGAQIGVTIFKDAKKVDVRGITKGRGFQGCIKRWGFQAGDKSHGSKNVREPGSTGMNQSPGRVFKGKKMPGHMGNVWRKVRSVHVVEVDAAQNLMLVKGAVPGPAGGYVLVQESLSG